MPSTGPRRQLPDTQKAASGRNWTRISAENCGCWGFCWLCSLLMIVSCGLTAADHQPLQCACWVCQPTYSHREGVAFALVAIAIRAEVAKCLVKGLHPLRTLCSQGSSSMSAFWTGDAMSQAHELTNKHNLHAHPQQVGALQSTHFYMPWSSGSALAHLVEICAVRNAGAINVWADDHTVQVRLPHQRLEEWICITDLVLVNDVLVCDKTIAPV